MKKWFYSIFFLQICSFANASEQTVKPKTIRILIEKDASEALLEVKGPYYLLNPEDGTKIASGLLGKRFMVHELRNGLKWGEEFPGIHQLYIKPRSSETSVFINGIQYSGGIAIFGVPGAIHIVNEVEIESYLKAMLTHHFQSPLEPEVLSSLAILMRTDSCYRALKNKSYFWHLTSKETGYQGCALVVPGSPIEKAVDTTRDLILVNRDAHAPFATTWTENSAGKTISYETMFRKDGSDVGIGVTAPHAGLSREDSKWSFKIQKNSLANLLNIPQVQGIETFVDPSSNKVYGMRVKETKEAQDLDFFALQRLLGKNNLLSSDFTVSMREDHVLFSGYGKGHGAGLCLYSASSLAQNGENAAKILSKFFPESTLININEKD